MSHLAPYNWHRDGNTLWETCPGCEFEFPVTVALAERPDVARRCPTCQIEFAADEAHKK
jgi:hypothetical protein